MDSLIIIRSDMSLSTHKIINISEALVFSIFRTEFYLQSSLKTDAADSFESLVSIYRTSLSSTTRQKYGVSSL